MDHHPHGPQELVPVPPMSRGATLWVLLVVALAAAVAVWGYLVNGRPAGEIASTFSDDRSGVPTAPIRVVEGRPFAIDGQLVHVGWRIGHRGQNLTVRHLASTRRPRLTELSRAPPHPLLRLDLEHGRGEMHQRRHPRARLPRQLRLRHDRLACRRLRPHRGRRLPRLSSSGRCRSSYTLSRLVHPKLWSLENSFPAAAGKLGAQVNLRSGQDFFQNVSGWWTRSRVRSRSVGGRCLSSRMAETSQTHPIVGLARAVRRRVPEVASRPVGSMSVDEQAAALDELAAAVSQLEALRLRVLAEADRSGAVVDLPEAEVRLAQAIEAHR